MVMLKCKCIVDTYICLHLCIFSQIQFCICKSLCVCLKVKFFFAKQIVFICKTLDLFDEYWHKIRSIAFAPKFNSEIVRIVCKKKIMLSKFTVNKQI